MSRGAYGPVADAAALRHPSVAGAARWLDNDLAADVEQRRVAQVFVVAALSLLDAVSIDSPELTTALNGLVLARDHALRASRAGKL